jgi:hypothetical protein
MRLTNTITVFELVWTVIGVGGFGGAVYAVREWARDRRAAIAQGMDAIARDLAFAGLVNASIKTFVFATYVGMGVFALLAPNTNPLSPYSILFSLSLIAGELALVVSLLFQQYVRRRALGEPSVLASVLGAIPSRSEIYARLVALERRVRGLERKDRT